LVKKIGRAGEGPKEFSNYVRVQPHPEHPDKILVGSHRKMTFFTRKGEYIKEVKATDSSTSNTYKPLNRNIYAAYGFKQDKDGLVHITVSYFDKNLKKLKEVVSWKAGMQMRGRPVNPTDPDLAGGEFRIYKGKLFVLEREEGKGKIFDETGKQVATFEYDYDRIPVTSDDIKTYKTFYQESKKYRRVFQRYGGQFSFPSRFPAAREVTVADDKIYVLTFKQKKGETEFVIFDKDGKFLKTKMLPFAYENPRDPYPYTIHNGNLYQLIDNQDTEEWELNTHVLN
jgi:uncharacterized protein YneR